MKRQTKSLAVLLAVLVLLMTACIGEPPVTATPDPADASDEPAEDAGADGRIPTDDGDPQDGAPGPDGAADAGDADDDPPDGAGSDGAIVIVTEGADAPGPRLVAESQAEAIEGAGLGPTRIVYVDRGVDLDGARAVIVSDRVTDPASEPQLVSLGSMDIPLMSMDDELWKPWGLCEQPIDDNELDPDMVILLPWSPLAWPLARGYVGDVITWMGEEKSRYCDVTNLGEAIHVASQSANAGNITLFAYTQGAVSTDGTEVPARRIGFGIGDEFDPLSPDVEKPFLAAVRWLLGYPRVALIIGASGDETAHAENLRDELLLPNGFDVVLHDQNENWEQTRADVAVVTLDTDVPDATAPFLTDVPPMLVTNVSWYTETGLGTGGGGNDGDPTEVQITQSGLPLLRTDQAGTVDVGRATWIESGSGGGGLETWASTPPDPVHPAWFGYPAGSELANEARTDRARVGFGTVIPADSWPPGGDELFFASLHWLLESE